MNFLSLMSGCGGMDLGLEKGGLKCKGQVEIMPYALKILNKHWPEVPKHTDILTLLRSASLVRIYQTPIQSGGGNDKKVKKVGQRGLCVSATSGKHNDPQFETIIASTVGTSVNPDPNYGTHFVAHSIQATPGGNTSPVWQDTYIAEIDANREGKTSGIPSELHISNDSRRGIVIGNAVTVQVAQWIGERLRRYDE